VVEGSNRSGEDAFGHVDKVVRAKALREERADVVVGRTPSGTDYSRFDSSVDSFITFFAPMNRTSE
jgi:hypothetical protein